MNNFIEEMKWRGMIHDMMPGTEEQFKKEMTAAYVGIDPTADSLHIGHLVSIMMLKHLQLSGHKPFVLVGGATGMIGDPSGKSQERNLLSEEVLQNNVEAIKNQLSKFLIYKDIPNAAEVVNNYDWFKDFDLLSFLRDVGKHITVSYMTAKDSVQKRLETGLSFTEFSYQLIQGYDFYHLNKEKNCKVQMGGSDQWGNIVTGTELIRRKSGGDAFALTCPLLTKADGTKFGKTESGTVWLDASKTSPYKFYQFWLNASDEDAEKQIKIFTLLNKESIENLIEEHKKAPHQRLLQKTLAEEVTILVHTREALETAINTSEILFGNSTPEDLIKLSESDFLDVFEGVTSYNVSSNDFQEGINIVDLLGEKTKIFPSKGEARKMIQAGGVSLNKSKVQGIDLIVNTENLLHSKYLLAQKGKKNYFLIKKI
jgi:tyrosyl-tRNA synthetase